MGEELGMGQKTVSQCLENSGSKVILSAQRLYGFGDQEPQPLILQVRLREDEWLPQDNLSGWFWTPRWESWLSSQVNTLLMWQRCFIIHKLASHNNRHLKHHNFNFLYTFYFVTPLIRFGLIKTTHKQMKEPQTKKKKNN